MSAKVFVWKALKAVGNWVIENPNLVYDKIAKIPGDKKSLDNKEYLQTIDAKVNQLGAAVMELDQKNEIEVQALRKQIRTMKIALLVMGVVLSVAVIAAIVLAIF